jgi:siderophore synthetase component
VCLPRTGVLLAIPLLAPSAIGHHRLGRPLWRVHPEPATGPGPGSGPGGGAGPAGDEPPVTVVDAPDELAALLAGELVAATEPDEPGNAVDPGAVAALRREVASSADRSARYVAARLAAPDRPSLTAAPDAQAAEGALAFGHPFHPTPKLADGFSLDDAAEFAPELGGAFPLWWIAAPPDLVEREDVPGAHGATRADPVPPEVAAAARAQLGPTRSDWLLLPCHPWQARALAASDDLAAALDDGAVRLTGPLGPDVRPTASVRTVRLPDGSFWKLSLDVRITNFVRHNTPEQVRRTLDASRIVTALPRRLRSGRFEVLAESAYRALALPGAPRLTTATAALHRPAASAPDLAGADPAGGDATAATAAKAGAAPAAGTTPPLVVAALVEPDPLDGVPPLRHLLEAAARSADAPPADLAPTGRRWLRAYLRISLRPLLRLLLDQGISLEAHTQNSLAGFDRGWPSRLVVRDLEGTSVDRTHPLADAHRRMIGTGESPVLYSPEEAWHRFAYYVVVNHLGQVVATVAAEAGVAEDELWSEVAALVRAEADAATGPPADHLRRTLLGPRLPAKANMVSGLLGCREEPVYVEIPNPCAGS